MSRVWGLSMQASEQDLADSHQDCCGSAAVSLCLGIA